MGRGPPSSAPTNTAVAETPFLNRLCEMDHDLSWVHDLFAVRQQGQVEEALKVMHFDRLSIYRPA